MSSYRVNYIDGHDLRFKSFETPAESEAAAISALWNNYESDFDHHIVEIIPLKEDVAQAHMRIEGLKNSPSPAAL